ncbi:MAG TPA: hypothetical protein VNO17_03330 [Actinomycetota bacterium]|nr:hypothetical protein [Actinomycetota bacterium]
MPFVSGATVEGLPGATVLPLASPPAGGLMGWLAPVAVPSPDGRSVAYNTFRYLIQIDPERSWSQQGIAPGEAVGIPSIHVADVASGSDSVLADGAFSLAWRSDGVIAHLQGESDAYEADRAFRGDVVVQGALGAAPER